MFAYSELVGVVINFLFVCTPETCIFKRTNELTQFILDLIYTFTSFQLQAH